MKKNNNDIQQQSNLPTNTKIYLEYIIMHI